MAIINENKYDYLKLGPVTDYENFLITNFDNVSNNDDNESQVYKIQLCYKTLNFDIFINENKKFYYINSNTEEFYYDDLNSNLKG